MGNSILYNTAGSIALAVNYVLQGPYSDKFLTKEGNTTVRINSEFFVRVDDAVFCIDIADVDLDEDDLDTGESFDASDTYYIYACHPLDGTLDPVFKISKNATYPSGGWTAGNSRKIGGFDTDGDGYVSESTLWDLRTTELEGMATSDHDATHIKDGSDEIDGDKLDIDFDAGNYTPDTSIAEATSADHLAAHLKGIDNALPVVASVSVDTGTTTLDSFADTLGDAAHWNYKIKKGANIRAGTMMAAWDASGDNIEYAEDATNDVGDTGDLTLGVDISSNTVRLRATATSDGWTVKVLRRVL